MSKDKTNTSPKLEAPSPADLATIKEISAQLPNWDGCQINTLEKIPFVYGWRSPDGSIWVAYEPRGRGLMLLSVDTVVPDKETAAQPVTVFYEEREISRENITTVTAIGMAQAALRNAK